MSRGFLAASIALLLVVPARNGFADDWPQFLGPTRDGVIAESNLISKIPAEGPTGVFLRPIGAGFAGPVVSGGKLVLFQQTGDQEVVEGCDPLTGVAKWQVGYKSDYRGGYGTGPGPRATPTISRDKIYTLGGQGMLQCLNLADGAVVWRRPLFEEYQIPESFFGVTSSPIVAGGKVYVNVGAAPKAGFVAFDAATGKTVWESTDETASYSSPVFAKFKEANVVLFFARTGLHAIDPATGKQLWFFRWRARGNASVNAATPIVTGSRVFITSSYDTGAAFLDCRPDGYDVVWKNDDSLSSHYNTPVLHEGYLYGSDGRAEGGGRLRCVELATGKVAWTNEGYGCASILRAGDRLLVLSDRGQLEMIRATPKAFESLGAYIILKGLCRPAPALSNGRLYARSESELICVDLRAKP